LEAILCSDRLDSVDHLPATAAALKCSSLHNPLEAEGLEPVVTEYRS